MGSRDRKKYLTATVLDQDFLDDAHDNLVNQLEMICEISVPSGSSFATDTLYLSDRDKYVGEHFYESRINFPPISRTVGTLLSPVIEFAALKLKVNNADGKFNVILPGGAEYDGFINREVVIRVGLRDVASTYSTIFSGFITDIGGFSRDVQSFTITARDRFDELRTKFPTTTFTRTTYPDIDESVVGKVVPYILGDWRVNLNTASGASVPAFPVNGASASVLAGNTNLSLIISDNANQDLVTTAVVLERGQEFFTFNSADVVNVNGDKNEFEIKQSGTGGVTTINGSAFTFVNSDKIYVQVLGKSLPSSRHENAVEQARDILLTYTSATASDFDANWDTFATKSTPAQSNIAGIKSRLWIQKQRPALEQALSFLEQVRLEGFIDRNQKLKINSLHFEDWDDAPSYIVRNWDVKRNTFTPKLDDRTNVNRIKGFYNFLPDINENFNETNFFKNTAAITQQGKSIEKGLAFPNLHVDTDVENQTIDILRITSGFIEHLQVTQTWRSFLLDIGDFVTMDVQIGGTIFEGVPCMIREIGYNAKGLEIPTKYWSFQLLPFQTYAGAGGGITGGQSATITEET